MYIYIYTYIKYIQYMQYIYIYIYIYTCIGKYRRTCSSNEAFVCSQTPVLQPRTRNSEHTLENAADKSDEDPLEK